VAGNGNTGVGNSIATPRPGQPTVDSLAGTSAASGMQIAETDLAKKERPGICVAMTQQSGEFGRGNQSTPQGLLQLVGCREPNARLSPWVPPRPLAAKQ
jgi:hypothetical protein